jgi:hypothetical protein
MAEITIEVRSSFQRMLLDTLWQFERYEDCLRFRDSLPNQAQRDICTAMIDMLIAATFDSTVATEEDCETARAILSSY